MIASASGNDTLTTGGGNGNTVSARNSTGTDILTAGGGNGAIMNTSGSTGTDTLRAGSGTNTLIAGLGNGTLQGGNGYVTSLAPASGRTRSTTSSHGRARRRAARSTLPLPASPTKICGFSAAAIILQIDLLGTTDQITLTNSYTKTAAQVQSFHANGLTRDTQVAQLVQDIVRMQDESPTGFGEIVATIVEMAR